MRRLKAVEPLVIEAPAFFSLLIDPWRDDLLAFLHRLRKATLVAKRRVTIDFTRTQRMFPEGTLLFAAELDRINRATSPRCVVRCRHPKDNVVEQVLQHLGLLEMMKAPRRTSVLADNVRHWRVATATEVDGSRAQPVIDEYVRLFPAGEAGRLFKGLSEAMTNTKHHAYTQNRGDGIRAVADSRWWMFCQEKDGRLYVAFCDLGIGIDRSLREGRTWSMAQVMALVELFGGGKRHSSYIKAAVELGKSRTREEYRGKGLQDLKAVFEDMPAGWLRILSNRGMYRYDPVTRAETLSDFPSSIYGTLISWLIPLPKRGADDKS